MSQTAINVTTQNLLTQFPKNDTKVQRRSSDNNFERNYLTALLLKISGI